MVIYNRTATYAIGLQKLCKRERYRVCFESESLKGFRGIEFLTRYVKSLSDRVSNELSDCSFCCFTSKTLMDIQNHVKIPKK